MLWINDPQKHEVLYTFESKQRTLQRYLFFNSFGLLEHPVRDQFFLIQSLGPFKFLQLEIMHFNSDIQCI